MIFFSETKTTKQIHNTNDTPKIRSYLVRESGKKKCGIHLKYICMYMYGMNVFTKGKNVHWHTKEYGECMRIDKLF